MKKCPKCGNKIPESQTNVICEVCILTDLSYSLGDIFDKLYELRKESEAKKENET